MIQIYIIHVLCYDTVKHCENVKNTKIMKHNSKMMIHFNTHNKIVLLLSQVLKGTRHKQNSLSGNKLFNYMPTYTRSQKKS